MIVRIVLLILATAAVATAADSDIDGTWVLDAEQTANRTLTRLQAASPGLTREQLLERLKNSQQGLVIGSKKLAWQLGKTTTRYEVIDRWDDGMGDIYLRCDQPNPVAAGRIQKVFHFKAQQGWLECQLLVGDNVVSTCYARAAK
jgi:hypothetical protein